MNQLRLCPPGSLSLQRGSGGASGASSRGEEEGPASSRAWPTEGFEVHLTLGGVRDEAIQAGRAGCDQASSTRPKHVASTLGEQPQ